MQEPETRSRGAELQTIDAALRHLDSRIVELRQRRQSILGDVEPIFVRFKPVTEILVEAREDDAHIVAETYASVVATSNGLRFDVDERGGPVVSRYIRISVNTIPWGDRE